MPQDNRFPFSEARIRDYPAPPTGRVYVHDTQTPHLQVCITDRGARTYYYGRRIEGRPVRIKLGTIQELPLHKARDIAARMSGEIAEGRNPHLERRLSRLAPTLGDLWKWWELHRLPQKRTARLDKQYWHRFLEGWKHRPLARIERRDVQELHHQAGNRNGPICANRLIMLLKSMYAKAENLGYEGRNPCKGIELFPERERDRFLNAEELRAFFAALDKEDTLWQDFFKLCLLTGARKGSVLTMRWQDIDFDNSLWHLPDTKSGKPVVVTLVPAALEILRRRQQKAENGFVFPGRRQAKPLHGTFRAWRRIIERAGLKDAFVDDLRRTLGSWQAISGSSLLVIGKSLGHTSLSATGIYARLSHDAVRESVQTATDKMLALMPPKGTDGEVGQ